MPINLLTSRYPQVDLTFSVWLHRSNCHYLDFLFWKITYIGSYSYKLFQRLPIPNSKTFIIATFFTIFSTALIPNSSILVYI